MLCAMVRAAAIGVIVSDLERAIGSELIAAGGAGHKEPWDAVWGQRYAQLRDPDGNAVELFAPLEA
jgi:uncharacterized glyoxalase superfamily protein PhnB